MIEYHFTHHMAGHLVLLEVTGDVHSHLLPLKKVILHTFLEIADTGDIHVSCNNLPFTGLTQYPQIQLKVYNGLSTICDFLTVLWFCVTRFY